MKLWGWKSEMSEYLLFHKSNESTGNQLFRNYPKPCKNSEQPFYKSNSPTTTNKAAESLQEQQAML